MTQEHNQQLSTTTDPPKGQQQPISFCQKRAACPRLRWHQPHQQKPGSACCTHCHRGGSIPQWAGWLVAGASMPTGTWPQFRNPSCWPLAASVPSANHPHAFPPSSKLVPGTTSTPHVQQHTTHVSSEGVHPHLSGRVRDLQQTGTPAAAWGSREGTPCYSCHAHFKALSCQATLRRVWHTSVLGTVRIPACTGRQQSHRTPQLYTEQCPTYPLTDLPGPSHDHASRVAIRPCQHMTPHSLWTTRC